MIIDKKYLVQLIQITDIVDFKKENETIWVKYSNGVTYPIQCTQEINRLRGEEQRIRQLITGKMKREEEILEKDSIPVNSKKQTKINPELVKLGEELLHLEDTLEQIEKTIQFIIKVRGEIVSDTFNTIITTPKTRKLKEVPLHKAVIECLEIEEKRNGRTTRADICKKYLLNHVIKGKKDYTTEKLVNRIATQKYKER